MAKPPTIALSPIGALLAAETAGGFLLMAAAVMALIVANSPWSSPYFDMLHRHIGPLSLLHWINDGLMALFFLLVGLELKRELIEGELSSWQSRALPGAAALAGMIAPALVYVALNAGHPGTLHGWAIPAATDIAFALGVLALLGRHAPVSIKVLLTAIAVVDDLGAILIIAFFYTATVATVPLLCAAILLAILITFNRQGVRVVWPYLIFGAGLWIAVFLSGVHATLAGVATAMTVPLRPAPGRADTGASPLHRLEHRLNPLVAFAIVPVFGFANAGVRLIGLGPEAALGAVPLGIALGLILGKQIGIFGACAAMIRAGLAPLPEGANWRQLYGMAILCGIGFTMSLFIGGLAFGEDSPLAATMKIGVLGGSLVSALLGYLLLRASRVAPGTAEKR